MPENQLQEDKFALNIFKVMQHYFIHWNRVSSPFHRKSNTV